MPPESSEGKSRNRDVRRKSVQSPLETYLREINETALLSADEEKELARRIADGDCEARDHMTRANLRLVVNIARSFTGKGLGLQDLIEEGNLGLLRAVEGFDPRMNTRFATYATYWIKQSIKRALLNTAKTIRIPIYMIELLAKWRRTTIKLQDDLGRTPTFEEVGKALGLPRKKLLILKKALRVYNASQAGEFEDHFSLEEMIPDENAGPPDVELIQEEELAHVQILLKQIDPREAAVLRMRFGLDNEEPKTLKEIGEGLGLTRERVRQIESDGLSKLSKAPDEEVVEPTVTRKIPVPSASTHPILPILPSMIDARAQAELNRKLTLLRDADALQNMTPAEQTAHRVQMEGVSAQLFHHLRYCWEAMHLLLDPGLKQQMQRQLEVVQQAEQHTGTGALSAYLRGQGVKQDVFERWRLRKESLQFALRVAELSLQSPREAVRALDYKPPEPKTPKRKRQTTVNKENQPSLLATDPTRLASGDAGFERFHPEGDGDGESNEGERAGIGAEEHGGLARALEEDVV